MLRPTPRTTTSSCATLRPASSNATPAEPQAGKADTRTSRRSLASPGGTCVWRTGPGSVPSPSRAADEHWSSASTRTGCQGRPAIQRTSRELVEDAAAEQCRRWLICSARSIPAMCQPATTENRFLFSLKVNPPACPGTSNLGKVGVMPGDAHKRLVESVKSGSVVYDAAPSQLGDRDVQRPGTRVQVPVPVPVTAVGPLVAAGAVLGPAHAVGLRAQQGVDERAEQLTHQIGAGLSPTYTTDPDLTPSWASAASCRWTPARHGPWGDQPVLHQRGRLR